MNQPIVGLAELKKAVDQYRKNRRQMTREWKLAWDDFGTSRQRGKHWTKGPWSASIPLEDPFQGRIFEFSTGDFTEIEFILNDRKTPDHANFELFILRLQHSVLETAFYFACCPFNERLPWSGKGQATGTQDLANKIQSVIDMVRSGDFSLVRSKEFNKAVSHLENARNGFESAAMLAEDNFSQNHDGKPSWNRTARRQLILRAAMVWINIYGKPPAATRQRPNTRASIFYDVCELILTGLGMKRAVLTRDIQWAIERMKSRQLDSEKSPSFAHGMISLEYKSECFDDDFNSSARIINP